VRGNRHHYCTAQTHEDIRIERQASDIFSSIRRTEISCESRHLYESNWTLHPSIICISNKITHTHTYIYIYIYMHETITDEWHTAYINPRLPSLWVDRERDFIQVVSLYHHTKSTKEHPVILVLNRHNSHKRNLEVINLARDNHADIICIPYHSSHKIQSLDKTFIGSLKTFYCQETEKWLR
jgi:hypothetical protein